MLTPLRKSTRLISVRHSSFLTAAALSLAIFVLAAFRPAQVSFAAARSVIPMEANPTSFPAGQRTNVTVTVRIPTSDARVTLVLQRLNTNGTVTQLGQLHDDGMNGDSARADGIYTLVVPFDERSAGEISLRVAAQPSAPTAGAVLMAQRPVYSEVIKLTVDQNKNAGSDSGASTIGQIVGGLLAGLGNKGNPKPSPPPPPSKDVPLRTKGLSLSYPPDWTFDAETLRLGGPINIRNFDNYQGGGIVPPGGAVVDITRVPLGNKSPELIVQSDLGAVQTISFRVADHSAIRAAYHDDFSQQLAYDNIAVYVSDGDLLYKFFLSFRADDPQRQKYLESFDRILSSVRFTE